ncbi:unnamed protein product [Aphanomyces euteiches]
MDMEPFDAIDIDVSIDMTNDNTDFMDALLVHVDKDGTKRHLQPVHMGSAPVLLDLSAVDITTVTAPQAL